MAAVSQADRSHTSAAQSGLITTNGLHPAVDHYAKAVLGYTNPTGIDLTSLADWVTPAGDGEIQIPYGGPHNPIRRRFPDGTKRWATGRPEGTHKGRVYNPLTIPAGPQVQIAVFEGESDVHAAGLVGIHAVSFPGVTMFDPDHPDATMLDNRNLLVWQENGAAAEGLVRNILNRFPDAEVIPPAEGRPDDFCDLVRECDGGKAYTLRRAWRELTGTAVTADQWHQHFPPPEPTIQSPDRGRPPMSLSGRESRLDDYNDRAERADFLAAAGYRGRARGNIPCPLPGHSHNGQPHRGGQYELSIHKKGGRWLAQCFGKHGPEAMNLAQFEAALANEPDVGEVVKRKGLTTAVTADPKPKQKPPSKPDDKRPQVAIDGAAFGMRLAHHGWEIRYNLRSQAPEWTDKPDPDLWDDWKEIDDLLAAELIDQLSAAAYWGGGDRPRGSGKLKTTDWDHLVNIRSYRNRIDPFKQWLDELPEWDGETRMAALCEALGADPDEPNVAALTDAIVGIVKRTHHPGAKHDHVVVLIGRQGCGKSTFCRELVPHPSLAAAGLDLDAISGGKPVERMLGSSVFEIDELAGMRRADLERMKAFLTREVDRVRLPYRRYAQSIPRRSVFVATTNNTEAIQADPTGYRRWKIIHVNGQPETISGWLTDHRKQLWAEASHIHQTAPDTWKLVEAQDEAFHARAEAARIRTLWEREVEDAGPELLHGMTSEEVAAAIGEPDATTIAIGRAMSAAGYKPKQKQVRGEKRREWLWKPATTTLPHYETLDGTGGRK